MKIILRADNDQKRTKGLMFHEPLGLDECAFFEFPYEGQHCFWNKNVSFPIALIFCNDKMEVEDIKELQAEQTESVKPKSFNIKYVVESHIDAPKKNKIERGIILKIKKNEIKF